jgi:hypothetical protein
MTNTNLRIPDELYKKLKEIAKQEDRSINGQIVHIIKRFIREYNQQQN